MAEKKPVQQAVPTEAETDAHVDDLVNKALKALEEFEDFTQEQVDYIVAKCSVAGPPSFQGPCRGASAPAMRRRCAYCAGGHRA